MLNRMDAVGLSKAIKFKAAKKYNNKFVSGLFNLDTVKNEITTAEMKTTYRYLRTLNVSPYKYTANLPIISDCGR